LHGVQIADCLAYKILCLRCSHLGQNIYDDSYTGLITGSSFSIITPNFV
jgi:hypothetical protein